MSSKAHFTAYISEDLKTQIYAGTIDNFSQRHLAHLYKTSTRPVGQALENLIGEGYLIRLNNGRIAVAENLPPSKSTDSAQTVTPPDELRQRIEATLVHDCLSGQENYIREEKMAEQFQIGRTALRNIFSELAVTGLIVHRPRKGWQLRSCNQKDLHDYLSIREHLECMALDLAKDQLDDEVLSELLRLNQEPAPEAEIGIEVKVHTELNSNSLHSYLITQADNYYLSHFFEQHAPFYGLLFVWEAQDPSMMREARAQHRSILQHLIDHNWQQAKEALCNHIWNNHAVLSERLSTLKNQAPDL